VVVAARDLQLAAILHRLDGAADGALLDPEFGGHRRLGGERAGAVLAVGMVGDHQQHDLRPADCIRPVFDQIEQLLGHQAALR